MIDILEFSYYLNQKIKDIVPIVYMIAPDDMPFPYATFEINQVAFDGACTDTYSLDLDIYSNSWNTMEAEEINEKIKNDLDGTVFTSGENVTFVIRRETSNNIFLREEQLKRINSVFTVKRIKKIKEVR